jgi:ESCRT-II complex subunit VPS22
MPKRFKNPKAARKAQGERHEAFKEIGRGVKAEQAVAMSAKLEQFKGHLEEFAQKHKSQISKDPAFRAQFNQMCRTIGVDPLQSRKGFWAAALGMGDFYYELGIQCIKVCIVTRSQNGGLIDLDEMCGLLSKLRGAKCQQIASDDVEAAVRTLKPLGSGYKILEIGNKRVIQSVPTELNADHMAVLKLLQETGHTTEEEICSGLCWTAKRMHDAVNILLEEGMVWIDDQPGSDRWYWSLCFTESVGLDVQSFELDLTDEPEPQPE